MYNIDNLMPSRRGCGERFGMTTCCEDFVGRVRNVPRQRHGCLGSCTASSALVIEAVVQCVCMVWCL